MKNPLAVVVFGALVACVASAPLPTRAAESSTNGERRPTCEQRWTSLRKGDSDRALGRRTFIARCLAECPPAPLADSAPAYEAYAKGYFAARWTKESTTVAAPGLNQDRYINDHARRCVANYGQSAGSGLAHSGSMIALGGLGAAVAGGAAAAASGGGHGSPPASP